MSVEANKAIIRRIYDKAINQQNDSTLDELIAPGWL